jgi:hypothetical protein
VEPRKEEEEEEEEESVLKRPKPNVLIDILVRLLDPVTSEAGG